MEFMDVSMHVCIMCNISSLPMLVKLQIQPWSPQLQAWISALWDAAWVLPGALEIRRYHWYHVHQRPEPPPTWWSHWYNSLVFGCIWSPGQASCYMASPSPLPTRIQRLLVPISINIIQTHASCCLQLFDEFGFHFFARCVLQDGFHAANDKPGMASLLGMERPSWDRLPPW